MGEKAVTKIGSAADQMGKLGLGYWEPEFWHGYRRGLNRLHHGNIFGSPEDHRSWHDIPNAGKCRSVASVNPCLSASVSDQKKVVSIVPVSTFNQLFFFVPDVS